MKRDHDNNKACAKLYRTGKQLSAMQSELEEAREKLKESNLALYQPEKLARGLIQKLMARDRKLKANETATATAAASAAV
eukprot:5216301-Pleurochrysis_carterae.AAC.1